MTMVGKISAMLIVGITSGVCGVMVGIIGSTITSGVTATTAYAQTRSSTAAASPSGRWKTIEFAPAKGEDLETARMLLIQDLNGDENLTDDAFITTARIDLDNDKSPELLIRFVNPGFCGVSSKCLTYVFYQKDPTSSWVRLLSFYSQNVEYFNGSSGIEPLRVNTEDIFIFKGGKYIAE